ncbi:hypothetical protein [Noviherbaspirillum malthae]|jgi:hypothetical protein|uniref:hypothetical protein n=1 Tax=Noviherbaspirillum malthae TaxID=1260987 RepID=UPI0018903D3F|nr:hypothetical protein [Noviherbaspirillum malthae]
MNGISHGAPIQVELDAGSIVVLPDELDVEVRCKSGMLWVAQLDNPNDLVIPIGGGMVIAKGKRSIVNAPAAASLEIHMAAPRQYRLTWDFSRRCHGIRHALAAQVLRVRGKCRIRLAEDGAAILV